MASKNRWRYHTTSWPTENLNLIQNREWNSFLIRFLNSTLITLHLMISMFNNVASVLQGREGIIIISSFLWIPSFYIQFLQFFRFRSTQSDKKKSSLSFHYICTTLSTARGSKDAIFSSTSKFNVRGHLRYIPNFIALFRQTSLNLHLHLTQKSQGDTKVETFDSGFWSRWKNVSTGILSDALMPWSIEQCSWQMELRYADLPKQ